VAGFHRGGGFQPRDKKLRAGGQTSLVLGLRFPGHAAPFWPNYFWGIVQFPQTRDTAIFLLTVRLLQDQYSHVLLKPFNREEP
jgi:hypothetical protein